MKKIISLGLILCITVFFGFIACDKSEKDGDHDKQSVHAEQNETDHVHKHEADHHCKKNVKRFGMVIGIKADKIDDYKELHADGNPGVRDLLTKYHMHNFSIYLHQIDGRWYEFGYYEYTGDDFEGDMAKLDKEPRNIEWLKVCDPLQIPLEGEKGWADMEQVYFNE